MPAALVTGAGGLVGSHIVERLALDGWTVRALARTQASGESMRAPRVAPVIGDVLDAESLRAAANGVDVIFHTAAVITSGGGWESYRRMNVDGTVSVIAAAEQSGARLVHLSSVAVYGPTARYQADGRTDEDAPMGPLPELSYYARSKRESEQLILDAQRAGRVWATALRPNVIYGPRDRQFVPRMARALRPGLMPVIGGGLTTLSAIHAANVADGAVRAAQTDRANGRAYNLTNDYEVTVAEFFRLAGEGLGRRVTLVDVPVWTVKAALHGFRVIDRAVLGGKFAVVSEGSLSFLSRNNPFTSARAFDELGWSPPVRPEVGVPDAFRWWAKHH